MVPVPPPPHEVNTQHHQEDDDDGCPHKASCELNPLVLGRRWLWLLMPFVDRTEDVVFHRDWTVGELLTELCGVVDPADVLKDFCTC